MPEGYEETLTTSHNPLHPSEQERDTILRQQQQGLKKKYGEMYSLMVLMVKGYSDGEIAEILGKTVKAVQKIRHKIKKLLGITRPKLKKKENKPA